MKIEELQPWHLEKLGRQGVSEAHDAVKFCERMKESGPSFVGWVDEGVVACVGLMCLSPGVYRCWALTDPVLAPKHFLSLNKAMRAWFAEQRIPRIETTVLKGNIAGHRWVTELLGFEMEGVMFNFYQGYDACLYARVTR